MEERHIDDIQTLTIDEHFKLLINDNDIINSNFVDITSNNLPNWYNEKLFKEAQNYYKRNIMLMIQASFAGLLAIIVVPETLKVLIYTQKSNMPCVTFSRYTQTLLHMYKLYTCDLNDANSDMYKTLNVIHRKHKMSSKRSENAGIGGIYQRDMAITQFAFIGYVLIAPKSIGLCIKPQEEEALNHFWRVMGHMLEIPDRLNLCRKTAAETRELCQKVANILTEYLNNAPMEFYHITSAILDGLWYFDVTLDKHAFLKFTYELHGIKYNKPLGWYSRLNAKYRDFIFYLCLVPYIGVIVKIYYKYVLLFTLLLAKKWPVLAWLSFGKKDSHIKLY
ncbi:PREDICTED: uncharacterized protein LOC108779990 [Cyphomyrmex costatus]|uniref:uncharacterized protein LOC108779990 n=1 Tax=Cyphomyrmex costatus TaxID=456900 RepID=UPI00085231E1|nr:PREDICTED: uncharacterized protein LOC108779990 [Cyphomyrmex costatus]